MIAFSKSSKNWLIQKINNDVFYRNADIVKGRVIDLGCGESPYKEDILKFAGEYIGVDWKKSFHDLGNTGVFADLSKTLPFRDCCADTVVSFQVLEHLPEPGFFLSQCYRILRSHGTVLLTVPFMWHVHEEPHDYFRFTRYGLEYLLKKSGFTDIRIEETTGFWQMWALKFNYHTERFAGGVVKYLLLPLWWLGQTIAPFLDSLDGHPQETASYAVIARKPV